jgi:hypothetical protein
MKLHQRDQKLSAFPIFHPRNLLQLSQQMFKMGDGVVTRQFALGEKHFKPGGDGMRHVIELLYLK